MWLPDDRQSTHFIREEESEKRTLLYGTLRGREKE